MWLRNVDTYPKKLGRILTSTSHYVIFTIPPPFLITLNRKMSFLLNLKQWVRSKGGLELCMCFCKTVPHEDKILHVLLHIFIIQSLLHYGYSLIFDEKKEWPRWMVRLRDTSLTMSLQQCKHSWLAAMYCWSLFSLFLCPLCWSTEFMVQQFYWGPGCTIYVLKAHKSEQCRSLPQPGS